MKRQIEIILLLLLVLGSIGINTVVVLILTVKTIISTILIDEIAKLAIALEQEAKYIYQTYPLTKSIAEQVEVEIIDFKGKEI